MRISTLQESRFVAATSLLIANVVCFAGQPTLPVPKMTFLDNGVLRIGMDLALGGAVTFISSKDHPGNIINSADLGRQIQMSHYSGPWPFEVGDKKPHPAWVGLGWNPIQTGDCYLNPSKVVEYMNDGKRIYIKCIPMQWPLNNVPADCFFETWTILEGPIINMRFRCTNHRQDKAQYHSCSQELPAVYTISKLWRLMSYTGDKPFTQQQLTQITNDWHKLWPWTRFIATEGWAALVDDNDWGLGVFQSDGGEFHGGIYGDARTEDPKHNSTAYLAPIHVENFDDNIVYDYHTDFILGKLPDIREQFNQMAVRHPPVWRFARDRQHWTLRDASDQGFPLNGEWRIKFGAKKPRLESGLRCWNADDAPGLDIKTVYNGQEPITLKVFWNRLDDPNFDGPKSLTLKFNPGRNYHTYHLALGSSPEYRGLITGLAIEPTNQPKPGDEIGIQSIALVSAHH